MNDITKSKNVDKKNQPPTDMGCFDNGGYIYFFVMIIIFFLLILAHGSMQLNSGTGKLYAYMKHSKVVKHAVEEAVEEYLYRINTQDTVPEKYEVEIIHDEIPIKITMQYNNNKIHITANRTIHTMSITKNYVCEGNLSVVTNHPAWKYAIWNGNNDLEFQNGDYIKYGEVYSKSNIKSPLSVDHAIINQTIHSEGSIENKDINHYGEWNEYVTPKNVPQFPSAITFLSPAQPRIINSDLIGGQIINNGEVTFGGSNVQYISNSNVVYVSGNVIIQKSFKNKTPSSLLTIITNGSVTFTNAVEFDACIYAEKEIIINQPITINGAIIAKDGIDASRTHPITIIHPPSMVRLKNSSGGEINVPQKFYYWLKKR
ncbi:hypothetical protein ACFL56_01535 [Candidatus Margulisiibacteriota bacterium]